MNFFQVRYIDETGKSPVLPAPFHNVDQGDWDKSSHPYSYDPFTVWTAGATAMGHHGVYTDRMRQWDYEKFSSLKREIFGTSSDYWNEFKPKDIERFLCAYLDKPVKLVRVIEYCNQATGYPLWYLSYDEVK